MKRPFATAGFCALVSAFVLLLACGRADVGSVVVGQALRIAVPPLPAGEVNNYRIVIQGIAVGTRVQTTGHIAQNDVTPAFVFTTVDRTRPGSVDQLDSVIIYATRDSMTPLAGFHFRRVGPILVTAAALYRPGSVGITTYEPRAGEVCRALPFPPGSCDLNQLPTLGRAIHLASGSTVELAAARLLTEPAGGTIERIQVTAGPDEMVTVPAGTFDCRQLLFVTGTDTLRLWVEKAGPQRTVRSLESGGHLVELVS
ncbi:hypothetical protein FJY71_02595 [candidate division WOR-3 bacterium]|nr:hypothetical protein [candidate division WOR-3 bacterium]